MKTSRKSEFSDGSFRRKGIGRKNVLKFLRPYSIRSNCVACERKSELGVHFCRVSVCKMCIALHKLVAKSFFVVFVKCNITIYTYRLNSTNRMSVK